jgi:hypothetical protein
LTDVLIVGVVLLLLFGIVGLMSWAAFAPIERQARIKAAMAQIGMFESALGLYEERIDSDSGLRIYRIDVGDYPSTEQGLEALMVSPPNTDGWQGPYLAKCSRKNDLGNSFDAGIGKSGVKSVPVVQVIYARMLVVSSEGHYSAGRTARGELADHTSYNRDGTRPRALRSKALSRARERIPGSRRELARRAKRWGISTMTECGSRPAKPRSRSM